MADKKDEMYLVGWCPDCGRTVVVRKEDEWTCGCGHDLLNLTACSSPVEIAEAVALMETVKNDALREPDAIHRPTLAEEAANARAAAAASSASRDLMKMGSNRARSSCLRSTWMARRRNCAALARPTYTACRGYGGYYVSTILAL